MIMIKIKKYVFESLPKNIRAYQLEMWCAYLNLNIRLGERFRNPLRNDNNPGAVLRENNGYIRLFDPPCEYHGMHIFNVIQTISGITDFYQQLGYGYYELLQGKVIPKVIRSVKKEKKCIIRVEKRNWNILDQKFWNGKTEITKRQLRRENHFPIKKFSFTSKGYWHTIVPKIETYVDIINQRKKIYCPAKRKWITNFGIKDIGGNKPFTSRTLYLTKNSKSYMILCNMGLDSRYTISEGSKLPIEIIQEWDILFDRIWLIYDDDLGGILGSTNLITQWNNITGNDKMKSLVLPKLNKEYVNPWGIKKQVIDIYDYTKFYNINHTFKLINEISRNL